MLALLGHRTPDPMGQRDEHRGDMRRPWETTPYESKHLAFLRAHQSTWRFTPLISVLVPTYNPDTRYLQEALRSVASQSYDAWEICLVDDASTNGVPQQVAQQFERAHPGRLRFLKREVNGHISAASNSALRLAQGELVALLDHDDRLLPHALSEIIRYANLRLEGLGAVPEVMYSDETTIHSDGSPNPGAAFHKPDWAPEFHLRVNYTTHLSVYSAKLLRAIGGFREGLEGAQDHDLMLRAVEATNEPVLHVPEVLYEWRAHPHSTASGLAAKDYATSAGIRAVQDALDRRGLRGTVRFNPATLHYDIRYDLPDPAPRASIVVPTRDTPELVRQTLSNCLELTDYPDLELVLVDNGTVDEEALALLATAAADPRCRVVRDDDYFNFARLCNRGVAESTGDVVVLLNNDMAVVTRDWLRELVSLATLEGVGAVGPKILTPSGRVQSAGLALLGDAIAGSFGAGEPARSRMYVDWLNTVHEVSAVTGACLAIRRSTYQGLGGLDEVYVPNAYGDVDLCLKAQRAGWRNLFTPEALLIHEESSSRGVNHESFERWYMRQRWGSALLSDPYVNPNLVRSTHFAPDMRYRRGYGMDPLDSGAEGQRVNQWTLSGLRRSLQHEGWGSTRRKIANAVVPARWRRAE
jgi:GT2 family glycosyltransferase